VDEDTEVDEDWDVEGSKVKVRVDAVDEVDEDPKVDEDWDVVEGTVIDSVEVVDGVEAWVGPCAPVSATRAATSASQSLMI